MAHRIEIVSGEGAGNGTVEAYEGKQTALDIYRRLVAERAGGDRWAYARIDGERIADADIDRALRINYTVSYPRTPGATPTIQAHCETIGAARIAADEACAHRKDLKWCDVRIDDALGNRVEYDGPAR